MNLVVVPFCYLVKGNIQGYRKYFMIVICLPLY